MSSDEKKLFLWIETKSIAIKYHGRYIVMVTGRKKIGQNLKKKIIALC